MVKVLLLLVSLVFTGLYLFLMEYYFGMEGLRLALLWLLVIRLNPGKSFSRRTADQAKKFLPYAIVVAVFLYWRDFYFLQHARLHRYRFDGRKVPEITSPWRSHLADHPYQRLFRNRFFRLDSAALYTHFHRPPAGLSRGGDRCSVCGWFDRPDHLAYLAPLEHDIIGDGKSASNWSQEAILVGAFALVIALTPASFSALNVAFDKTNYDRFTLPGIIAACLLLIGIVFAIKNKPCAGDLCAVRPNRGHDPLHQRDDFANDWKNTRET